MAVKNANGKAPTAGAGIHIRCKNLECLLIQVPMNNVITARPTVWIMDSFNVHTSLTNAKSISGIKSLL